MSEQRTNRIFRLSVIPAGIEAMGAYLVGGASGFEAYVKALVFVYGVSGLLVLGKRERKRNS